MRRMIGFLSCLVILTAWLHAQNPVPSLMSYQGRLTKPDGTPVADGEYSLSFRIYDQLTNGTLIWQQTINPVVVKSGVFAVLLGNGSPLSANVFNGTRYLEIQIGGQPNPLSPRLPMVSVAYAFQAERAQEAQTVPNQSITTAKLADGAVTTANLADGAVSGNKIANNAVNGSKIENNAVSRDKIADDAINSSKLENGAVTQDKIANGAINADKLNAAGASNGQALIYDNAQPSKLRWGTVSSGNQWTTAGNNIFNANTGNVGIGTSTPSAKLDVVGGAHFSGGPAGPNGTFANLVANASNVTGGGILISDDGGFYDFNDGWITFKGHLGGGLRVAGPMQADSSLTAIKGVSSTGITDAGVFGESIAVNGNGVIGRAMNGSSAFGVWGISNADAWAGYFSGDIGVTGNIYKGGGGFKIDHPLDPANKYLYHSFVESPDMKNVYDGVVTLDAGGEAWVTLPDWFEAVNKDYRYQLTAVGVPAPGLYVAERVQNNRFKIAGGSPGQEVCWQITGIRKDPYAQQHRIPLEVTKPYHERDYYLHPDVYGQPESRRMENAQKLALPSATGTNATRER